MYYISFYLSLLKLYGENYGYGYAFDTEFFPQYLFI